MRLIENFNQGWFFTPRRVELNAPDSDFHPVTLPHTSKLFTHRFVDNKEYQFVSTYRKRFSHPITEANQQVFIDFEGAMLESTVYLNGQCLGRHQGGYTPFSFELTPFLTESENILTVYVDATEKEDIPPYGGLVDFLTFGGLYREVFLRIVNPCHILHTFVKPLNVLSAPQLDCEVQLNEWEAGMSVEAVLQNAQGEVLARQVQAVEASRVTLCFPELDPIRLWTLENPVLYQVVFTLLMEGKPQDQITTRFGFRSAEFREDGLFYFNGAPLKLFGLNRHQTYPYLGVAAPARLQQLDADILKYELGCNVVRTSHYVQSRHFLDRCDEIGLLVFEEIPGWKHIGNEEWQHLVLRDVQVMIERDRNRPSIMLWGVRINESPDHESLYTQTNELAHRLDATRQTGGVRDFINSQKLEDVFTLNDFPEGLQDPLVRPHLITEFAGHMFPTKAWDHEERRVEQALKHAQKHNLQMGHPDVAGAIGWCAFDYHTHQEFGSGDRICHHGVMDLYRLPKLAAYFYRSQKLPSQEIVLQAATNWTMGDRSGGGNNPLVIFSNCEEVEVLIGNLSQGKFRPDAQNYPHLPYPPFIIRWAEPYNPWGTPFWDLTVRGYIQGKLVAEQQIAADHLPMELRLSTHTTHLKADGSDMARVVVQVVDRYGNVLPYQLRIVNFTVEGEADLIGESPLALWGGQGACYIRACHTAGRVTIHAHTLGLPSASIELQIEA